MWSWFSLSYAGYLVVPRAALCSMPADWQARMVALLEEMNATIEWDGEDDYVVSVRQGGKFASDPLARYRHPPTGSIRFKAPPTEPVSNGPERCPHGVKADCTACEPLARLRHR